MIEIARTTRSSRVSGEEYFARWCDLESHPEWAPSMEYFRLRDPFGLGATGVSRPRGGGEATFTVTALEPSSVYADTTQLEGAALTVHHRATPAGSGCVLELTAWLEGPRERPLAAELGDVVQTSIERDLESLVRMLESRET